MGWRVGKFRLELPTESQLDPKCHTNQVGRPRKFVTAHNHFDILCATPQIIRGSQSNHRSGEMQAIAETIHTKLQPANWLETPMK